MKLRTLALVLSLACAAAPSAHAGGGYFNGAKGARAAGRAGAFTAKADDLSAVAFNPAGLTHIDTTLIQVGNRFSYNQHSFERAPTLDWGASDIPPYVEFERVENQKPWQLLDPILGVATNFGLRDWAFALAAYAPAGVGREEYPVDGGQRYMMVSREAIILNYSATAAWKFRELFGLGASLQIIAVPTLKYSLVIDGYPFAGGAGNPVSSGFDILAVTEGKDLFTPNLVLGGWYRPASFLELGLSAQVVPAAMTTDSKLSVSFIDQPEEVGSLTLERNGQPASDVSINFPMPLTFRAGARYRHMEEGTELFDVELDLTYETWSRVERFTVETDGMIAFAPPERIPVGTITIEKHWRDTLTIALGGDYNAVPDLLTARGGVYYETAVSNPHYLNIDFASGTFLGFALGGSLHLDKFEVAVAYELRHQPAVRVTEGDARVHQEAPGSTCVAPYTDPATCDENYLGKPAPPVNAGVYRAHSHVASLDVLYRF